MEADGQVRADDGYRVRQSRLRTPRGGIRNSRFSRGTSVRIEFGSLRGVAGSLTNRGRRPGRLQRQSVHWPRHVRQVLRWARSCLPKDALPATICRMWNSDRSRRPEPVGGSRPARAASTSRFRGSASVTSESRRCRATAATSVTARLTAASLARDGLLNPEIFLTNWREAFRISASVVGGSKLNNGLMLRHMSFGLE